LVLTFMGKLPPTNVTFAHIGLGAAILFFVLWIALPIITKIEKKL